MLFSKFVVSLALVAFASAQHGHDATSYASYDYNADDSQEYQAAPIYHQAAAPAYQQDQAHVHAVPVYHHAPAPVVPKKDPVAEKHAHHEEEEHYAPVNYQFKYAVNDEKTHDIKEQAESGDGDVVKGYYSLVQPDGVTRIVHYTADKHSGFQAQVEYSGHANHPEVEQKVTAAPSVVKTAAAIPVEKVVPAPVYKTAPVYKVPAYPHF